MRRITRIKRWTPVFPNPGNRGRLFFYSGAKRNGFAAFFHRHHGNGRHHLHLVEVSEPAPEVFDHHGGEHKETSVHSHRHQFPEHGQNRIETEPTGHWHFTFAETPDLPSTSARCLSQVLTCRNGGGTRPSPPERSNGFVIRASTAAVAEQFRRRAAIRSRAV